MLNVALIGTTAIGFGIIFLLLALGHPGVATQFSSYLFAWLVGIYLYEKIRS